MEVNRILAPHEEPMNSADETVVLGQSTVPLKERASDGKKKKYEFIRPLGKGGFAWVYLVKNLDLDRLEAIKILSFDLEDEEVLDRFVKEARISANFNNQNIITIFEVQRTGTWDEFIVPDKIKHRHPEPFTYFTMSFVEGNTAASLLKKEQKVHIRKLLKIAIGSTRALDYAHEKAVTHRDIKPENIMVDRHGEAIVMDFGIAKAANQTRKTAAGTFMGTARYVSPEQAMGNDVDGRSDLYSLGITLYEMVTGRPPFDSDEWMTVLYQHIHESPPPPSDFFPEIDRDFQNVLLKLLEKDPNDRYQSARELLLPLQNIYNRLGGEDFGTEAMDQIGTRADLLQKATPSDLKSHIPLRKGAIKEKLGRQEPPVQHTTRRVKTRTWPKVVAGGLVLIVLSYAAWWFTREDQGTLDQPPHPPLTEMGKLYISVFPTGKLVQIMDEKGHSIKVNSTVLPQNFELATGSYDLVVALEDRTQTVKAFIQKGKTQHSHVYFEIDESDYLLEDLK